jgi:hypothetical protein
VEDNGVELLMEYMCKDNGHMHNQCTKFKKIAIT